MILGEMVVGDRPSGLPDGGSPYSSLSANPDAAIPQGAGAQPCIDCADSYGVADRLRARSDDRMGDAFRELGEVDVDPVAADADEDDYRYGGRFPDPEPRERESEPEPGIGAAGPAPAAPVTDALPDGELPRPSAEN